MEFGQPSYISKHGMVPSMWKKGIVVLVLKKKGRKICETDNICCLGLVSVVHKMMCSLVQERLVQVIKSKQLLAKAQTGFQRGRGCRDQTLTLLGQMKVMTKKRGVFTAFFDFQIRPTLEWIGI